MARVSLLPAVILVIGCAKNGGDAMVILANTAAMGSTCMLTGSTTQPTLSQGVIYSKSPTPYLLTPLIESRITAEGSGVEVDRSILLTGANVTLSQSAANGSLTQLTQFNSPVAGSIAPGTTVNVSFVVVPVDTLAMFATSTSDTQLIADVQVIGTEGGGEVDSEPFRYGITVGSDQVVNVVGNCEGLTAVVRPGNPCNPYQDGIVDCCLGAGAAMPLVCPGVAD